jgi:hypothetical protein
MPDWDACAGRHLLAHIMKAATRKHYYCAPEDTARGASSSPAAVSIRQAAILRSYAHCWALDMADWPTYPPTAAEQREAWGKAMQLADRDCKKAVENSVPPREIPDDALSDDIPPR